MVRHDDEDDDDIIYIEKAFSGVSKIFTFYEKVFNCAVFDKLSFEVDVIVCIKQCVSLVTYSF